MNGIQDNSIARTVIGVALMFTMSMGGAFAAEITNNDSAPQTIVVTEGASKREVVVAPGETIDFCSSGCFVTFPNGDREALTGDEAIAISSGKAKSK